MNWIRNERTGSEVDVSPFFESAAEAFTASGQVFMLSVGKVVKSDSPAEPLPAIRIDLCLFFFFAQQSYEAEEGHESPVTEASVEWPEPEVDA